MLTNVLRLSFERCSKEQGANVEEVRMNKADYQNLEMEFLEKPIGRLEGAEGNAALV